jgi:hypothetical protein
MKEIEMKNLSSSQIKSIGYDIDLGDMYVEFNNGKVYKYVDVPEWTYNALLRADSPGKFFHGEIKNHFDYENVMSEVNQEKLILEEY